MPRGRKPRTWVKIDCNGILRGSINWVLSLDEQAVWIKLIAYSEVCGGDPGFIQDNDGRGLPRDFLSHELHAPYEIMESTIEKMKRNGSIAVNGKGVIHLIHFNDYQFTEYDRQRPYRQAKKGEQATYKVCEGCGHKLRTADWICPKCGSDLKRDYAAGKYGHVVKR